MTVGALARVKRVATERRSAYGQFANAASCSMFPVGFTGQAPSEMESPSPEYLWGYHREVIGPKASKQSAGRLVNLGKDRPEVLRIGGPERAASANLR